MATTKRGPKDLEVGSKFKRMLPCPITPAAGDKKAREIVEVLTEVIIQKEKAKPFHDKVKELTLKVESLRHDIKNKTEDREVNCVEERDYKHRAVRVRRIDTRAVVEERPMTDEDRQEELGDLAKGAKRPPEDGGGEDNGGEGEPPN